MTVFLPYTTLASTLQQLVYKGYVTRQKHRNRYWFTPCVSAQAYGQQRLAQFVSAHFQGSYAACLTFCVQQGVIPLAALRALSLALSPDAQP